MSGLGPRFDPSELADAPGGPLRDADSAGLLATARDLEEFARTEFVMPTVGFEDRVMEAVAAEAPPNVVTSGAFLPGLIAAVRVAWRITWSGGRPMAVRAQAFALVLLVAVATGSAGTLAAVGAASLLSGDEATPTPTVDTSPPLISPSPSPSFSPSPTPSPTPSPSPSESPEPSASPDASESAEPTATNNRSGATQAPTRTPPPTARPTATPNPTPRTPDPTQTPNPSDTPEPSATDDSSDTPEPTST